MKKTFNAILVIALLALVSCNNTGGDSAKVADSSNTAKIDSAQTADTIASKNSHLADLKPDAAFAVAAADGGMLEVTLGKLAVEKGASTTIRSLGAMMVKDHSKANDELTALAKTKDISLPASMSDKCQKTVADLSSKTGVDFDKAYADLMVSDHKDDIDEFKKEAEKGMDKQLSSWATSTLPVLKHHLTMAESAKKIVEKG